MKQRKLIFHLISFGVILIDVYLLFKIFSILLNENEKGILLFFFLYPTLIITNLIIGILLNKRMEIVGKYLITASMSMAIMSIPLLLWVTTLE